MSNNLCRVLVTGADGFIGKNLIVHLSELPEFKICTFTRSSKLSELSVLVAQSDVIVHLAGENRPRDEQAYSLVNTELTKTLCNVVANSIQANGRKIPIILASSAQAVMNNAYGQSKLAAECAVSELSKTTGNPSVIFRFPGIFGKWCKPNYNSVVATFCYNIARNLPIKVDNKNSVLQLVYIDDVVAGIINHIRGPYSEGITWGVIEPEYAITLGDLAEEIKAFSSCRGSSLSLKGVGVGFLRALYATYVSNLPSEEFSYQIVRHEDARGVFVELLKTSDCGQISYFTAHPGVTRGGHYHHTKTEKFLVVKGRALFRFRHLITNEQYKLETSSDNPCVVDTIPGWAHDITNVGSEEMVVMLWANENFDHKKPDTVTCRP